LAAKGVRVVNLPGTRSIGIEVANEKPSTVSMLSVLEDEKFKSQNYDLPVAIGMTITNEVMHFDLAKMPHLLVAGATGQGKSVGLNAILTSLLYSKHPSEMKLVLVDPKKVELSLYSKLEKHFLAQLPDADEPVITDNQKVIYTMKSLCIEMDARYDLLRLAYVRNIKEYNEKFLQRKLNPLKGHRYLPYIVVVIDEFADLIMTAGREIEEPIARLAQLARAVGIHLVIATQRPTTQVITGNIKANFPARIAFMVRSGVDSKTILDTTGANQLIGKGDMLISNGADLTRVQCAFIDTKEVEGIVDYISSQRGYATAHYLPEYVGEDKDEEGGGPGEVDLNRRDSLFEDAAKLVVMHQQGSTSLIQRKMSLGYNRAGRIMDQLEVAGIVGPYEGSKARQVLVADLSELDARLANIKDIYG
jgi:S-DNA-T family DNA segregation ATPase FtsK/SpoIIIE